MIIKPKVRGFVCVTAHPTGCAAHIQQQIDHVKSKGPIKQGPKNVLVIGASTGYGLASRVTASFGSGAATLGVFYERPSEEGRPATPGWYNSIAFTRAARAAGYYAENINGDAFSEAIKQQTLAMIARDMGPIDLVVYSLASPRRTHPKTGARPRPKSFPGGEARHQALPPIAALQHALLVKLGVRLQQVRRQLAAVVLRLFEQLVNLRALVRQLRAQRSLFRLQLQQVLLLAAVLAPQLFDLFALVGRHAYCHPGRSPPGCRLVPVPMRAIIACWRCQRLPTSG